MYALLVPRPKRTNLDLLRAAAALWDAEDQEIGYLARLFTQTSLPFVTPVMCQLGVVAMGTWSSSSNLV